MSESTRSAGFRQYARDVSRRYFTLAVLLPLAAGLIAIAWQDAVALNLVHVVAGAAWAGATFYIAGVLSPTLLELEPPERAKLTVPLIPKHILLYSALAAVTLLTGVTLAGVTGQDHGSPVMVAAWVTGAAVLVIAGYLIRVQAEIYREVHGEAPDMARVGHLANRLRTAGVVGGVAQLAVLVVMALLRFA